MSEPKRIQRRRTAGWRMPDGAVYVGRPTKWGNPYVVHLPEILMLPATGEDWWCPDNGARAQAVRMFADAVRVDTRHGFTYLDVPGLEAQHLPLRLLAGRDLACWCPLDQPCHADVLLQLANPVDYDDPIDEYRHTQGA